MTQDSKKPGATASKPKAPPATQPDAGKRQASTKARKQEIGVTLARK